MVCFTSTEARITVFSLTSCPHCKKAKAFLADKGWDYTEISLSDYPEKRGDMLELADRLTVPQIFFGDAHLGGAADLEKLEQRTLQALYDAAVPSADARMRKPDYAPKAAAQAAPRTEEPVCFIGETCLEYPAVMDLLRNELPIQDRKVSRDFLIFFSRGVVERQCFSGAELADLMLRKFKLRNRGEAVQVCEQLKMLRFYAHIEETKPYFDGKGELYRLQQHAQPLVLNTARVWRDLVGDPMTAIGALKKTLEKLEAAHSDKEGRVDAHAVLQAPGYAAFREAVCELQGIKLEALDEETRIAFCINAYNMMVRHAFMEVGRGPSCVADGNCVADKTMDVTCVQWT